MLIKVLHSRERFKKVISWNFQTKRFNWSLCWKLAFSVLVLKDKKNITTQETQFIEILHTVPKWVSDYAV